ncbi:unnamed protein product [Rotaria socialis]|uniref:Uncharacterized protein n=1 Tax=Rotaria socialis TaxID=392032 RepID=A0A819C5H6_9BILA|nr:unnamed protein product [Rotaria socialis]
MIGQSYNCVFSIFILILCISTNVLGNTCSYLQKTCSGYGYVWCCEYYEPCGNYFIQCTSYQTTTYVPTPALYIPSALVIALVIMSIFVFGICLSCCVGLKRQQQQRTPHIRVPPSHRIIHPYEQQSSPAVHIRSVYATHNAPLSSRMPVMHEEQPPSYEAAVANLSSKYHTEPSPLPSLPVREPVAPENARL